MPNTIRVLWFDPGREHEFRDLEDSHLAWRSALGTKTLDFSYFSHEGRRYYLWCDDFADAKQLAPNRELRGGKYDGHVLRGPFFITRIRGEFDTSVDESDLEHIWTFITREPIGG